MQLISYHIDNFGKISNENFNFHDGINPLIEKNGYGKSTIAAFIKAMLYGMESVKSNSKDFKERTHYAPFNGQSYGGTLTLTHKGQTYVIKRTFDVKSSANDKTEIYVDRELISFDQEIGEKLLGLDKESFERLLFIDSTDIKIESNGNIRKNLNNILDDQAEGIDFESIKKKLTDAKKKYGEGRNTETYLLKQRKKTLEEEIINKTNVSLSLGAKYEKRNKLNDEREEYKQKQDQVADKKQLLECWETYHKKLDNLAEKEGKLAELLDNYPKGYPTKQELSDLENYLNQQTALVGEAKGIIFSDEKEQQLNTLKNKYLNEIPTEPEMEKLKELDQNKQEIISSQNSISFSNSENERLEKYSKEFENGIPKDDEIALIERKIDEYNRVETVLGMGNNELSVSEQKIITAYENHNIEEDFTKVEQLVSDYKKIEDVMKATPRFEDSTVAKPKKASKLPLIALLVSIVFIGAGIAMFFVMLAIGIALSAVGVLALFASAFLYLKGKIDSNTSQGEVKTNAEYMKQDGLLRSKAEEIHKLLTPYGIYTESVFADFEKFKNECERFKEIKDMQDKASSNDKENKAKLASLKHEIQEFLSLYVEYNNYSAGIQQVKEDLKLYEELNQKHQEFVNASAKIQSAMEENDKETNSILLKYNIPLNGYKYNDLRMEVNEYKRLTEEYKNYLDRTNSNTTQLNSINMYIREIDEKYALGVLSDNRTLKSIIVDVLSIDTLKKDIASTKEDAEKYKIEKSLGDEAEIDTEEQLDFMGEIANLADEIAILDNQIDQDEREIEGLEDNKEELENIKEQIKMNEHRYKILSKLDEELSKSQKTLDDKYVSPIMDKFEYYSNLLGNILNVSFEMNKDFSLSLMINGVPKSDQHLSSGQRSICALCFRLALLDNIFNGDMPFLIMDDPFLFLDKENFAATANMMKELSRGKQIIYFSCHESREI